MDLMDYYYHDLRKKQQLLSHRATGYRDIMIEGGISYYGKLEIKFIITLRIHIK